MKRNNFGYYVREGTYSIFTHGFMSFASVCIIMACLIIMGSFTLLAVNVNSIIGEFESENVILVYVHDNVSEADARNMESAIEAVANVDYAVFTSRAEAMERFVNKYEDKARLDNLGDDVLRHRFAVYVDDISIISQTRDKLAEISGVARANANLAIAKGFVTLRNVVSGVSAILVAILLIVSLFIMSNTIKLATFERREEIAIMKMVGATSSFIRWPFIFEGFILGLVGSLGAYLAQWGIYSLITDKIISNGTVGFISTLPFSYAAIPLLLVFIVIGFGVGVVGSSIAIRKYLKV